MTAKPWLFEIQTMTGQEFPDSFLPDQHRRIGHGEDDHPEIPLTPGRHEEELNKPHRVPEIEPGVEPERESQQNEPSRQPEVAPPLKPEVTPQRSPKILGLARAA